MRSHYQKAYFLLSAADVKQLPPDTGVEVAIVGRSNAGKSSVLNCITQNKGMARVSKTPGRTQLVNVFMLDDDRRLVDLPGYGFAKAPLAAKQKWEKTVNEYISTRESLKGLLLIMDIRHPLKELDLQMIDFCEERGLDTHIILNKEDKLSKGAAISTMNQVAASLTGYSHSVTLQLFSALKRTGVKELQELLDQWYGY